MEDVTEVKKKRGRKPKFSNELRKKWEPVKWQAHYDTIVALSCIGYSAQTIADKLKSEYNVEYTPTHINNILNTKQAEVLKSIISEKNRKVLVETIGSNLEDAAVGAANKIKRFVTEEQYFEASPATVVNASLKILQGVGKIKSDEGRGNVNIQNALIIPSDKIDVLRAGLDKANEVFARRLPPAEDK